MLNILISSHRADLQPLTFQQNIIDYQLFLCYQLEIIHIQHGIWQHVCLKIIF